MTTTSKYVPRTERRRSSPVLGIVAVAGTMFGWVRMLTWWAS